MGDTGHPGGPKGGLTLPEPVRSLWLKKREAIAQIADGRLMLHGGTVLAARWKHRNSIDIDVFAPDREDVVDLWKGSPNDIERTVGGVIQDSTETQIKMLCGDSVLDFAAVRPPLAGLESTEPVEGRPQTTLKTVQILFGKLARADSALPRDAVDYAFAARFDPTALCQAVNRLTANRIETIADGFKGARARIATAAAEALDVHGRGTIEPDQIAEQAKLALTGHLYTRVTARTERGAFMIETETRNGRRETTSLSPERAVTHLATTGIAQHLLVEHRVSRGRLAARVNRAILAKRDKTVFDTESATGLYPGRGHTTTTQGDVQRPSDVHQRL